ncbi:MAG: transposase [Rhodobacteraceae bacterium]|nr:transposase [Paracoccaceae bacterium]
MPIDIRDETGRLLLSRTAVSELGERLWADYQEFAARDLSEYDIAYLFVDGIAERIRPGQRREPVMAAWGFTATGTRVLLHLMAGSKEDAETVSAFFQDMRARGSAIRCSWYPTGHRGSSRQSRPASRARPASAAWRTGCAASPPRCPRTSGQSSRPASRPATSAEPGDRA